MDRRIECYLYQEHGHHQVVLPEVQGKLNGVERALALLSVNQSMYQYFANGFDLPVQMLKVVRRYEGMQRTELVSRRKATY